MDNKFVVVICILTLVACFFVCVNSDSNADYSYYEIESKKAKKEYDSLVFLYSIQIDSLIGVIDSIDNVNSDLQSKITARGKKDNENYKAIMRSSTDSSYTIIRNFTDSFKSVKDSL